MPAKRPRDCPVEGRDPEPEESEPGIRLDVVSIMDRLQEKLRGSWPEEHKEWLKCPFSARDPKRYAMVKDHACTGWGFQDIADLKDHIKRKHSFKYGCVGCGKRFHCRDQELAKAALKHEKECTFHPPLVLYTPRYLEPEIMEPEQDRVLDVDFRKSEFRELKGDVEKQYWVLCQKIWPGIQHASFPIWSCPGSTVSLHSLQEFFASLSLSGRQQHRHMAAGVGESAAVLQAAAPEPTQPSDTNHTGPYSMFAIQQPSLIRVSAQPAAPTQDSAILSQHAGDDSEANGDDHSTLPTDICPDPPDYRMSEDPCSPGAAAAMLDPPWPIFPGYCSHLDMAGLDNDTFEAGYFDSKFFQSMAEERDGPSNSDAQCSA